MEAEETPLAAPLDARQLGRIEGLHRGFLYQHLYAGSCMLLAQKMGALAIVVERDEDVEVKFADSYLYAQVKTRTSPLIWSDIETAIERFDALRRQHAEGARTGPATFVVVSNVAPGPFLIQRMAAEAWPADVTIIWPENNTGFDDLLPAPQIDTASAFAQCASLAVGLPFASLAPDTLAWKLAGVVMTAAAGTAPFADHTFHTSELHGLFEQILIELREFPSVPADYRPQENEPELESTKAIRLITGFSGAGKTTWVSYAAQHAIGHVVYFDVVEMPGPALANGIARELAARLAQKRQGGLGAILLPGASGPEILGLLEKRLAAAGETVTIVLDNVHRAPPQDIAGLVRGAGHFRFLLLAQPGNEAAELAAGLSLSSEGLSGWAIDTVAEEVTAQKCRANFQDCERLAKATAAMPLFVRNAVSITRQDYDGSVRALCDDLDTLTHSAETAQELILSKSFDALSVDDREGVAVLSVADIPLERELVSQLFSETRGMSDSAVATMLRRLRSRGFVEIYPDGRQKTHDAMRLIGQAHLASLGEGRVLDAQRALKDILAKSMREHQDFTKLPLFLRLLSSLGDVKTLVQFAGDELFHELGFKPDVMTFLEKAANSPDTPPEDRFWALDGLVFSDAKRGELAKTVEYLDLMDGLIEQHDLGADERLAVAMKRMSIRAAHGDAGGVDAAMREVSSILPDKPNHQRIFRYNAARALWSLKQYRKAADESMNLILEYYDVLGISPADVVGRNAPALWALVKREEDAIWSTI